jgi:hypothetical protein
MYYAGLGDQLDKWRSGVGADPAAVEDAVDADLPRRLKQIAGTAETNPGEAFADLVAVTSLLNAAALSRPSILEKITKHVEQLRDALEKVARGLRADSFDISVSVPVGLSVSVTFKVQAGQ